MNIDATEARRAVEASLARGSATPDVGRSDRAAYIAEMADELLGALIRPSKAVVMARTYDYEKKGLAEYENAFAVARRGDSWLLYTPDTGGFGLAFGSKPEELTALGFSSDDVLAEWNG